jgi:integrase/recombinase XerC
MIRTTRPFGVRIKAKKYIFESVSAHYLTYFSQNNNMATKTFPEFQTWLTEQDRSEKTVNGYLADLKRFGLWFAHQNGDELTPLRLTPTDIRLYRTWLQEHNAKPNTINRQLAAIRAYAKWSQESEQINTDPMRGVRPVPIPKLAPKWLDRGQQHALISTAEKALNAAKTESARMLAQRDLTIVKTLLLTGLRVSELCALNISDVIIMPRKGKIIVRQGKGERRREVPLNADARESLTSWLELRGEDGILLFSGKRGDGISISGVHRRLAELGRIAKVDVHPHTLRHTFSKNLIDAGVSLEKVASLLGHSSLNTTKIYTTPGERDLEIAVEKLA